MKIQANMFLSNDMKKPVLEKYSGEPDRVMIENQEPDKMLLMAENVKKMSATKEMKPESAIRDTDYEKAFRRTSGWTGGDGTYSIPLGNGKTMWLFGDTLIDDVLPSGAHTKDTIMINNSIAIQNGREPSHIEFLTGGTDKNPDSFFKPPDGHGWFWIHDALPDKDNNKVFVFLDQIEKHGEGVFGFRHCGTWIAEVDTGVDKITVKNYEKIHHFQEPEEGKPAKAFGASILIEKEWTYIYGTEDYEITKNLLLARIKSGSIPSETPWEFYTGTGWSKNLSDCKPVFKEVGNELSVHKNIDGRYIITTQKNGSGSDIEIIFGSSPEGPWNPPLAVWHIEESNDRIFSYNAKAHPELSDTEKGLLISYNVNAWNFDDLYIDSTIYRPRFIRVRLDSDQ